MSGARLRIKRAKAERRGFPFDQIRGFFDPAWYSWAYDTSGFENTSPIGQDDDMPTQDEPDVKQANGSQE